MRSMPRLGCGISWQKRVKALRARALTSGGNAAKAFLNRCVFMCRKLLQAGQKVGIAGKRLNATSS